MVERVNKIRNHPRYKECFRQIQTLEKEREFCRHTMEHFMDVARLAYIFALEEGMKVEREVIYAAALLHDIGRHLEYTQAIPHHEGSARIAGEILPECGFSDEEQRMIIEAILLHRKPQSEESLSGLLYRADKMSRICFVCPARESCNWSTDRKNMKIKY